MPLGPNNTGDGGGGGDGIINLGGIPGIQQGPIAGLPAAGVADGVWYLATDTQILYRWDLASATWVEELNDGSGAVPKWQVVMDAGNTSNTYAILQRTGTTQNVAAIGDIFGFQAGAWAVTNPGGFPLTSASRFVLAYVDTAVTTAEGRTVIQFYNGPDGDADATNLLHRINTARRLIYLPDKSGDMVLGATGKYTATLTNGQTSISIPHGMWPTPLGPIDPTNACINPTTATTQGVLAGGYYLTYDTTNIIINLTVPVVGTPAIIITWTAFV